MSRVAGVGLLVQWRPVIPPAQAANVFNYSHPEAATHVIPVGRLRKCNGSAILWRSSPGTTLPRLPVVTATEVSWSRSCSGLRVRVSVWRPAGRSLRSLMTARPIPPRSRSYRGLIRVCRTYRPRIAQVSTRNPFVIRQRSRERVCRGAL